MYYYRFYQEYDSFELTLCRKYKSTGIIIDSEKPEESLKNFKAIINLLNNKEEEITNLKNENNELRKFNITELKTMI